MTDPTAARDRAVGVDEALELADGSALTYPAVLAAEVRRLRALAGAPTADVADELAIDGASLIAGERSRQLAVEGWSSEHDDAHGWDELPRAAACYATPPDMRPRRTPPADWPWSADAWKPSPDDRIRELVKAGALIAAEIDRIRREGSTS